MIQAEPKFLVLQKLLNYGDNSIIQLFTWINVENSIIGDK